MNFKIFSIIAGILITTIAILSGTYYYLFEYSKPKSYNSNTYSYSEQQIQTNNNINNSYSISNNNINAIDTQHELNNNSDIQHKTTLPEQNQNLNNHYNDINNTTNSAITESGTVKENNQDQKNNEKTLKQNHSKEEIKPLEKENNKREKILEKENALKKEINTKKTKKDQKMTAAYEYLSLGKNSRLEPELSTENMKVYILDGKFLSQYRIDLLKEMLSNIKNNSKDYYLSIFIKMLPKGEMKITIYNKDIIFSDMKKAYKYINMDKINPYLKTPEEINKRVAREEILERFKIQMQQDGKGSNFSQHIRSLKNGLDMAQYFFPFCEIIEINSIK